MPSRQFIFDSVSSLAGFSVPLAASSVLLTQQGREGIFIWNPTNLSTYVSNDPGQGIYIAPLSNFTGSNGAWVRNYDGAVNLTWWGAIGDGVVTDPFGQSGGPTIVSGTDNTQALANWNVWARYQSYLGKGVVVEPTAGTYIWDGGYTGPPSGVGYTWMSGIKNLYLRGNKSVVFQNRYNQSVSGASFAKSLPWPVISNGLDGPSGPLGYFIDNTNPGDTTFTVTTASEAANLTVGEWALLGSLDVQYSGYPFNLQNFEFVQIKSINSSTGVVQLFQPIVHEHRSDYPDFNLSGFQCGRGRVWLLNQYVTWDVDHTLDGIQVNLPPGGGQTYATLSGRKITTIDWYGVGFSETIAGTISHVRPRVMTNGETDKLIESISYYDADMTECGLSLQSVSPKRFNIYGGKWASVVGCSRNMRANSASIQRLQLGSQYGLNEGAVFESCNIQEFTGGNWSDGSQPLPFTNIDGIKRTYADGIITVNITTAGSEFGYNHAVPGQMLMLEANASIYGQQYAGNQGLGIVTAISSAPDQFLITTTFPYSSLPAWATGNVYFLTQGPTEFINCTGSDSTRQASDATKSSFPYFGRPRFVMGGLHTLGGNFFNGGGGSLQTLMVNVVQPSTTAAANLSLSFFTASDTTYVNDGVNGTVVTINYGIGGKRRITTSSFDGQVGTDGITVNGVGSSFLPQNRVLWLEGFYVFDTVPASLKDAAIVEVIMELDFGLLGKRITRQFNIDTATDITFAIQGLLV